MTIRTFRSTDSYPGPTTPGGAATETPEHLKEEQAALDGPQLPDPWVEAMSPVDRARWDRRVRLVGALMLLNLGTCALLVPLTGQWTWIAVSFAVGLALLAWKRIYRVTFVHTPLEEQREASTPFPGA